MKKEMNKTWAIILLLVLIAIGGIVLYGEDKPDIKNGPASIPKESMGF